MERRSETQIIDELGSALDCDQEVEILLDTISYQALQSKGLDSEEKNPPNEKMGNFPTLISKFLTNLEEDLFGKKAFLATVKEKLFFKAAANGNAKVIQAILDAEVDPNLANKAKNTTLIIAIKNDHSEVVEVLLENDRTDCSLKNNDGFTAIELADPAKDRNIICAIFNKLGVVGKINALNDASTKDNQKLGELLLVIVNEKQQPLITQTDSPSPSPEFSNLHRNLGEKGWDLDKKAAFFKLHSQTGQFQKD